MPAPFANSVSDGFAMPSYSQIANVFASTDFRKTGNVFLRHLSQIADMDDDNDKNGGPNHLRAWMRYREIKGAQLAEMLGVTPGMVSDLANSKRALSAKWLRRIAPLLKTTPGHLLDHDPYSLSSDIVDIWLTATEEQRRQLARVAEALMVQRAVNE